MLFICTTAGRVHCAERAAGDGETGAMLILVGMLALGSWLFCQPILDITFSFRQWGLGGAVGVRPPIAAAASNTSGRARGAHHVRRRGTRRAAPLTTTFATTTLAQGPASRRCQAGVLAHAAIAHRHVRGLARPRRTFSVLGGTPAKLLEQASR
jgi:hypothetical protein